MLDLRNYSGELKVYSCLWAIFNHSKKRHPPVNPRDDEFHLRSHVRPRWLRTSSKINVSPLMRNK